MQRHQDEAESASGQEGKASGEAGRSEGRPKRAETCSDVRAEEIWSDPEPWSAVAAGTQSEAAQEMPSEVPAEPRQALAEPREVRPAPREPRPERVRSREQGQVEALRAAVLAFARARLAPLAAEDAAAIASLSDENELRELVDTLSLAESVSDARAVLDAAIDGRR